MYDLKIHVQLLGKGEVNLSLAQPWAPIGVSPGFPSIKIMLVKDVPDTVAEDRVLEGMRFARPTLFPNEFPQTEIGFQELVDAAIPVASEQYINLLKKCGVKL